MRHEKQLDFSHHNVDDSGQYVDVTFQYSLQLLKTARNVTLLTLRTRLDEFIKQITISPNQMLTFRRPVRRITNRCVIELLSNVKSCQPTPLSATAEDIVLTEEVENEALQHLRIRSGACLLRAWPRFG